MGFACCAFLLACGGDGSTTRAIDNPDEKMSSSNEMVESCSSMVPEPVEESSSSVDVEDSTLTYERECGKLVDSRDGKTYCTVKIGTQTWMGENFNYEAPGSICYQDDPDNCEKFGRLYTYPQVMGRTEDECGAAMCRGNYPMSPGICPEGWTVPTRMDWETLESYIDKHNGSEPVYISMMAKPEDSKRDDITIGSDLSGFRILMSGTYNSEISAFPDSVASFWTSTEESSNFAYEFGFDLYRFDVIGMMFPATKWSYRSLRCIKDENFPIF